MPVKQSAASPIPPAVRFYLLTGRLPAGRIHGWVDLVEVGRFGQPTLEDIWHEHAESLIAQARSAGFEPFMLTERKPTGAAVRRWAARFVAEHRY